MGELLQSVDSWAALAAMFRLFPAEMVGVTALVVSAVLITALAVALAVRGLVVAVRRGSTVADTLLAEPAFEPGRAEVVR